MQSETTPHSETFTKNYKADRKVLYPFNDGDKTSGLRVAYIYEFHAGLA